MSALESAKQDLVALKSSVRSHDVAERFVDLLREHDTAPSSYPDYSNAASEDMGGQTKLKSFQNTLNLVESEPHIEQPKNQPIVREHSCDGSENASDQVSSTFSMQATTATFSQVLPQTILASLHAPFVTTPGQRAYVISLKMTVGRWTLKTQDGWKDFSQEVSDRIENAWQLGQPSVKYKYKSHRYLLRFEDCMSRHVGKSENPLKALQVHRRGVAVSEKVSVEQPSQRRVVATDDQVGVEQPAPIPPKEKRKHETRKREHREQKAKGMPSLEQMPLPVGLVERPDAVSESNDPRSEKELSAIREEVKLDEVHGSIHPNCTRDMPERALRKILAAEDLNMGSRPDTIDMGTREGEIVLEELAPYAQSSRRMQRHAPCRFTNDDGQLTGCGQSAVLPELWGRGISLLETQETKAQCQQHCQQHCQQQQTWRYLWTSKSPKDMKVQEFIRDVIEPSYSKGQSVALHVSAYGKLLSTWYLEAGLREFSEDLTGIAEETHADTDDGGIFISFLSMPQGPDGELRSQMPQGTAHIHEVCLSSISIRVRRPPRRSHPRRLVGNVGIDDCKPLEGSCRNSTDQSQVDKLIEQRIREAIVGGKEWHALVVICEKALAFRYEFVCSDSGEQWLLSMQEEQKAVNKTTGVVAEKKYLESNVANHKGTVANVAHQDSVVPPLSEVKEQKWDVEDVSFEVPAQTENGPMNLAFPWWATAVPDHPLYQVEPYALSSLFPNLPWYQAGLTAGPINEDCFGGQFCNFLDEHPMEPCGTRASCVEDAHFAWLAAWMEALGPLGWIAAWMDPCFPQAQDWDMCSSDALNKVIKEACIEATKRRGSIAKDRDFDSPTKKALLGLSSIWEMRLAIEAALLKALPQQGHTSDIKAHLRHVVKDIVRDMHFSRACSQQLPDQFRMHNGRVSTWI